MHLTENHFSIQDGFLPAKLLAGGRVFEQIAPQRTSAIFGITEQPWAAAAYRIDELVIQLERHLSEWDAIAIEGSGKARLVRHNTVTYALQCIISPDITGLHSNFFYRCPECNRHIYECTHLLMETLNQSSPTSKRQRLTASIASERSTCPDCGGTIQNLTVGVSFCLDCDWECGLAPTGEV
jgi:hypothetical protein